MQAGRFDRRVLIESRGTGTDTTYGTPDGTWDRVDEVWAEVQDVRPGRAETMPQGLALARNLVKVRMRFRTDLDSSMRFTVRGDVDRVLQVIGGPAAIGGRKDGIEFLCEAVSA